MKVKKGFQRIIPIYDRYIFIYVCVLILQFLCVYLCVCITAQMRRMKGFPKTASICAIFAGICIQYTYL